MASVHLKGVAKRYGDFSAVRDIDLEVPGGSYYCLLGPSGSGKSTLLRLIAGLETLSAGQILIDDRDVSTVSPNRRPVHTVFQSYALFPSMSVYDNVAYGLRAQGLRDRHEISRRVGEALDQVRLNRSARQRPAALSGGMQQRVALARALINRPGVLLLDEPLGALDLQLRREMQEELVRLHNDTNTTFVHVTHDQEECFACATQVAVMRDGTVEQTGSPRDVYRRPRTRFAATFLGTANILDTVIEARVGDDYRVRWAGGMLDAGGPPGLTPGTRAGLVMRPEDVEIATTREQEPWIEGELLEVQPAPSTLRLRVRVLDIELVAERPASPRAALDVPIGGRLTVRLDTEAGWLVPEDAPDFDAATRSSPSAMQSQTTTG